MSENKVIILVLLDFGKTSCQKGGKGQKAYMYMKRAEGTL